MKLAFKNRTIAGTLLVLGMFVFAGQLKAKEYRVEYVSEMDAHFLYDLNKVKEKQIYILPNGSKLYFTSGTFACYSEAESELKRLKAKGFKTPKIRSFHNKKITVENTDNHICTCK